MPTPPSKRPTFLSLCSRGELAAFYALLLVALLKMRMCLWWIWTFDTRTAFVPWVTYIAANGHWHALKHPPSDYFPAYYYLLTVTSYLHRLTPLGQVKIIPLVFDFAAAWMAYRIVSLLEAERPTPNLLRARLAPLVLLALPSLFLDGAVWGQCDSIYITFLLATIYYLMREEPALASIAYGLAFCFKLQSVFFGPVFLVALLRGRVRWWHATLVPLIWAGAAVPMILLGGSVRSALGVAGSQVGEVQQIVYNVANPWEWFHHLHLSDRVGFHLGLLMTLAVAIGLTYIGYTRQQLSKRWLFFFATVSLLIFPYVMPGMHDRYFQPGLVFLVVLACHEESFALPAALFECALLLTYFLYFNLENNAAATEIAVVASSAGLFLMLRELRATWIRNSSIPDSRELPVG